MTASLPPRRCANPKCRRVLTDKERTFHCVDCLNAPEMARLAQAYWARVAKRTKGAA